MILQKTKDTNVISQFTAWNVSWSRHTTLHPRIWQKSPKHFDNFCNKMVSFRVTWQNQTSFLKQDILASMQYFKRHCTRVRYRLVGSSLSKLLDFIKVTGGVEISSQYTLKKGVLFLLNLSITKNKRIYLNFYWDFEMINCHRRLQISVKDELPLWVTSLCIYQFACSCGAGYIGRTN